MNGYELRQKIGTEEFDYQTLLDGLKAYKAPDQKINKLLKEKAIIRVKKGLYIFGPGFRREPYSKKLLSNWIYGPSYISLESALSEYGLIPERVEVLTSVTSKRNKLFQTPIGDFTYRYLNVKQYPLGVLRKEISEKRFVLIASVEKALVDILTLSAHPMVENQKELQDLLFSNLRIDKKNLAGIVRRERLLKIAGRYHDPSVRELVRYVEILEGQSHG